jgi:drug/metabolite transporter (DMT)-like permease
MNKTSKFGAYLVFFAALLWATDAPFRLHLTQNFSSNFIVLAEHFFDVVIILPVLLLNWREMKRLTVRHWLAIAVIAVGGSALASIAFTQAFHYVNPSVAILLQKLQPLIVIGLAASFLHEQIRARFWLWAVVALAGAYLISFPHLIPQTYVGETLNPNLIGIGFALAAVLLWGLSTVLGKYALGTISFKVMTSLRFVLAFVFLAILNVAQKTLPPWSAVTAKDWLFIFMIAMTSGVVSLFIYYRGLQYTKASVATLAELGFPLGAVIVNAIFLEAVLLPWQLAGMVVLLLAIFQLGRVNASDTIDKASLSIAD